MLFLGAGGALSIKTVLEQLRIGLNVRALKPLLRRPSNDEVIVLWASIQWLTARRLNLHYSNSGVPYS
jgi:hypothetical protein